MSTRSTQLTMVMCMALGAASATKGQTWTAHEWGDAPPANWSYDSVQMSITIVAPGTYKFYTTVDVSPSSDLRCKGDIVICAGDDSAVARGTFTDWAQVAALLSGE